MEIMLKKFIKEHIFHSRKEFESLCLLDIMANDSRVYHGYSLEFDLLFEKYFKFIQNLK